MVNFSYLISQLKTISLLFFGPLGCYVAYQIVFVYRHLSDVKYPNLAKAYGAYGINIDILCAILVAAVSYFFVNKYRNKITFEIKNEGFEQKHLIFLTSIVVFLMSLNVYTVLGSFSVSKLLDNFEYYYFHSTNGAAWMILACYAIIYALLYDLYLKGVTTLNLSFCLLNILLVSINGGRGLPLLFAVCIIVFCIVQKMKLRNLLTVIATICFFLSISWSLVTELRAPPSNKQSITSTFESSIKPTDSFYDLNYNAAFILNDVILKLESGLVKPSYFFLDDLKIALIPRYFFPDKPVSTAETLAIYPDVADRGTNITFPLKANLMLHLGSWAFYSDWLVVLIAQLIFVNALINRTQFTSSIGFLIIFFGCSFALIARGGIFNARLFIQGLCIAFGILLYKILKSLMSKVVNKFSTNL